MVKTRYITPSEFQDRNRENVARRMKVRSVGEISWKRYRLAEAEADLFFSRAVPSYPAQKLPDFFRLLLPTT